MRQFYMLYINKNTITRKIKKETKKEAGTTC